MTRQHKQSKKAKIGAASLVLTLILMTISTLIIIYAANFGALQNKSVANSGANQQAFEAARAGMEFGINYLNVNRSTILASPSAGYIQNYTSANTTNVALANGSTFSITYTNPTANNYDLIRISSTGTNSDGTSTKTVSQLVQYGSILLNSPTVPLTAKGAVSLGGNSEIINTYSNNTVVSGGSVSLSGSSQTTLNSGTSSTPGNIIGDVAANNTTLSGTSNSDLFASYFGNQIDNVKSSAQYYYSNSSNANYGGTLNGKTGSLIWIDQTGGTATINGNATIGSAANPVILVINGNVRFSGNVTIFGYIYVLGTSTTDLTGNVTVVGSVTASDTLNATGSIQVIYSPTTLDNLQDNASMRYYAKVPGSWRDF